MLPKKLQEHGLAIMIWLHANNKTETYILTIEHDREEFFTITQKTIHTNKEIKTETVEATLFDMDDIMFLNQKVK